MPPWRLSRTDEFEQDLRRACGKDRLLRERTEKKIAKILESPDRPRAGKSGALSGLRSERVNPYVILYSVEVTPADPPGIVHLRGYWHHNDPRYDP
jgi:mRNA-degrading endonuclease RelE of RelBE toxin-antitoxin system